MQIKKERQKERERERKRDRKKEREKERERERKRERKKERERERKKENFILAQKLCKKVISFIRSSLTTAAEIHSFHSKKFAISLAGIQRETQK